MALSELTIVTMTYERHGFLARHLDYLSTTGIKAIVTDGSAHAFSGPIPDNVEYLHMPAASLFERTQKAFAGVQTPYAINLADDDFLLISSLEKGVAFLNAHEEYDSVQGACLAFHQYFPTSGLQFHGVSEYAAEYSLEQDDTTKRLASHFANYMHTVYSLQRTRTWQRFADEVLPAIEPFKFAQSTKPAIFEFCLSVHLIASGKHKVIPNIWLVRENLLFSHGRIGEVIESKAQLHNRADDLLASFGPCLAKHFDVDWNECLFEILWTYTQFGRKKRSVPNRAFYHEEHVLDHYKAEDDERSQFLSVAETITRFGHHFTQHDDIEPFSELYGKTWEASVTERLQPLLARKKPFVLFGAGEHSRALNALGEFDENLVAVADNSEAAWKYPCLGRPCISPRDIADYADTVVISSQAHFEAIRAQLEQMYGDTLNIFCLYD